MFWRKHLLQQNVSSEFILSDLNCLRESLIVIRGLSSRSFLTFREFGLLLEVECEMFNRKKRYKFGLVNSWYDE